MYDDEDLLPISALQHLLFCERQCALIHMEQVWLENARTVEGSHLHRRADDGPTEARVDIVTTRAVPVWSHRLGITGRADVVEFVNEPDAGGTGVELPGRSGRWRPRPVEYKRGRPKEHRSDEVQLCAQGLCLEEMLGVPVESGDLFYGTTRRRVEVRLDAELREITVSAISHLRNLLSGTSLPRAHFRKECEACSLLPACLPKAPAGARAYVAAEVARLAEGEDR